MNNPSSDRRTSDAANRTTAPSVSVVSLSYERRTYVLDLLEALGRQDYPDIEVILVDNNSQDGTAEAVEEAYPQTRLIRSPHNLGMVAYNLGLANAKGDYIFVIDDDGLPVSDAWISDAVAHFEENPRLGALACTIRMADTGRVAYDSPRYVPDESYLGGYPTPAYNGTGAALRAEAIHGSGYYPFHFFRSWLELSLCTKLIDNVWEVRYFPELEVWHRRPSGSVNRPITYHGLRNYFWYVWTFYPPKYAVRETLHHLGFCYKGMVHGRLTIGLFLRAWFDAWAGFPKVVQERRPISEATLSHLRRIRRFRNDYGLAPSHRPFGLCEGQRSLAGV
jgi:GT2 family glycosyltransferase